MGDPQTEEEKYQRRSHTIVKILNPCQVSQPEDPTKGLGIPRESGLEGQWDLIRALPEY